MEHRIVVLGVVLFVSGCGQVVADLPPSPDPSSPAACGSGALDISFGGENTRPRVAGLSVAVDGACNILLAGTTEGPIDFGGGPIGAPEGPFGFVVKLDPAGNHVHGRALPVGAEIGGKRALAVRPDGSVLVAGTLHADVDLGGGPLGGEYEGADHPFLLALDAEGGHVFSKRLAGNLPSATDYKGSFRRSIEGVSVDESGDFVIGGEFQGELDLGGVVVSSKPMPAGAGFPIDYKPDVFVARYDREGNLRWGRQFGGDGYDRRLGLDVGEGGETALVYAHFPDSTLDGDIAGLHFMRLTPEGEPAWSVLAKASMVVSQNPSVRATEDGGMVIGGDGEFVASGIGTFTPAFVARLDASGNLELGRSITSGDEAFVSAVIPDEKGGIRAAGWFAGALLVGGKAMADSSGGLDGFEMHAAWDDASSAASSFGGAGDQIAVAIARTPEGDHVVAGIEGPLVFDGDPPSPPIQGSRVFVRRR